MTGWAGGYVADVEYITGFYRQQSAPHLRLAALLGGVDGRLPAGSEAAHYLELGCGRGMNAVLIAASNPAWQVTAVDYNPAHIAAGTALARDAGLANVTFVEADFGQLADRPMRPADIVSMHGVWSWVAPSVRADIVRLLRAAVAPGGLVHLSYNALPAWQGGIGLQRLIFEAGQRSASRSDRQATAGLAFANEMRAASARYLTVDPLVGLLMDSLAETSVGYLAHEYMNAHWSPCFHSDVAASMADAKLDWAASANLLEAFPELVLTEGQRGLLDRFDDPAMRELVKDCCLPRQLRHDVYVRGARRMTNGERDAALGALVLALCVPPADFVYELDLPVGKAEMGAPYRDYVAMLANGPASVAALMAAVPGSRNPAELAAVMVGTNQALIVPCPGAAQAPGADRLNRLLGHRVTSISGRDPSGGLACTAMGTGLPASRLMQFACARALDGEGEGALDSWFAQLRHDVPEHEHGRLRALLREMVDARLPLMQAAGIIPSRGASD